MSPPLRSMQFSLASPFAFGQVQHGMGGGVVPHALGGSRAGTIPRPGRTAPGAPRRRRRACRPSRGPASGCPRAPASPAGSSASPDMCGAGGRRPGRTGHRDDPAPRWRTDAPSRACPPPRLKEPRKVTMPGGRYSAPTRQEPSPPTSSSSVARPASLRSSLSATGSDISAKAALDFPLAGIADPAGPEHVGHPVDFAIAGPPYMRKRRKLMRFEPAQLDPAVHAASRPPTAEAGPLKREPGRKALSLPESSSSVKLVSSPLLPPDGSGVPGCRKRVREVVICPASISCRYPAGMHQACCRPGKPSNR